MNVVDLGPLPRSRRRRPTSSVSPSSRGSTGERAVRNVWSGLPSLLPEELGRHQLAVLGEHRAAERGRRATPRESEVTCGTPADRGRRKQPGPHPVGAHATERQRLVRFGDHEDDLPVAVQAAGRVGDLTVAVEVGDLRRCPTLALPDLPHQRWAVRDRRRSLRPWLGCRAG